MSRFTRRQVLGGSLAAGAFAIGGPLDDLVRAARAADGKTYGITWGGPWIEACKAITGREDAIDVTWGLHQGSSFNIIAKIASSWPVTDMDFVHSWPPVTHRLLTEGWLEPITIEDVPNLGKIPKELLAYNDKGQIINIPVSGSASFWSYDPEVAGMEIATTEDLFNEKLKGKVLATVPSFEMGRMLLSMALARGGDERNIDPGFEFVKDLARANMIGRVIKSDTEVINAFTSGEVAVGLTNLGNYNEIKKVKKVAGLNKVPDSKMFKTFVSNEEFVVLNNTKNRKATLEFLNFFLEAKNNTDYTAMIGHIALNVDSTVSPDAQAIQLKDDAARKAFGYYPDTAYISSVIPEWNRRWELEVAPLLAG